MKKIILLIALTIPLISIYSQSSFSEWDKNYKIKEPTEIIKSEISYAKKVENDTLETQYYLALETYRFLVKYTGNEREINEETMHSMHNVLSIRLGKKDVINYDNVDTEFEFISNGQKIWMPIQSVLKKDFKKEIKKGDEVLLYTLFMNEHTVDKKLYNTFYISEFSNNWK